MTPMRANIVGPPRSATRIKASIAACPCAAVWTFFGSPMMYLPASRRTQRAAAGQDDRASNSVDQSLTMDDLPAE
jgi:hypothetical protein